MVKEASATKAPIAKLTDKVSIESGVYTYKTDKLRVQVLSDGILRIEENADGTFTDKNTLIVEDRGRFEGERVAYDEDEDTVILSTPRFTVNIPKKKASTRGRHSPLRYQDDTFPSYRNKAPDRWWKTARHGTGI